MSSVDLECSFDGSALRVRFRNGAGAGAEGGLERRFLDAVRACQPRVVILTHAEPWWGEAQLAAVRLVGEACGRLALPCVVLATDRDDVAALQRVAAPGMVTIADASVWESSNSEQSAL